MVAATSTSTPGALRCAAVVEDPSIPGDAIPPEPSSCRTRSSEQELLREKVRVLLKLDAGKLDLTTQSAPHGPGFRVIWARTYGKGR